MRIARGSLTATVLAVVSVAVVLFARMIPARRAEAESPASRRIVNTATTKPALPPANASAGLAGACCNAKACAGDCACSCSRIASSPSLSPAASPHDRSHEKRSELDEPAVLVSMLPHASKVQKGQLVGELSSRKISESLAASKHKIAESEASLKKAVLDLEAAELKLKEYDTLDSIDTMKLRSEITIARAVRDRARAGLENAKKVDKTYKIKESGRFQDQLDRAETEVELAVNRLDIHVKYTSVRERKEIEAEVERAKAEQANKTAALELEKSRSERLAHLLEAAKLYAPAGGYVSWPAADSPASEVAEGVLIRPGQLIFRIEPGEHPDTE